MTSELQAEYDSHEPLGFSVEQTLYASVDASLRRRAAARIQHDEHGSIVVWPNHNGFEAAKTPLAKFCSDQASRYRVSSVRHEAPQRSSLRPIDELMWTIGFAASGGRLVDALSPTDVLQLTEWPNLTRVPLGDRGLHLAAIFCRYPTSIPVAQKLSDAERGEVHQFLSAAWCAGLARPVNRDCEQASHPAASEEEGQGSLIAALLRRLWS